MFDDPDDPEVQRVNSPWLLIFTIIFFILVFFSFRYLTSMACSKDNFRNCTQHTIREVKAKYVGLYAGTEVVNPDQNYILKDVLWAYKDNKLVHIKTDKLNYISDLMYIICPAVQFTDLAGNVITSKLFPKTTQHKKLTTAQFNGKFIDNMYVFTEFLTYAQNTEGINVVYAINNPEECYQ